LNTIKIHDYGLKSKGKFFTTQRWKAFFWQADTAWGLFHRSSLDKVEIYLDDPATKGFNMVLAVVFTELG